MGVGRREEGGEREEEGREREEGEERTLTSPTGASALPHSFGMGRPLGPLPPAAPFISLTLGVGVSVGQMLPEEAFAFTCTTALEYVCDSRCF